MKKIGVLILLLFMITGCNNELEKHSKNFFSFDTTITLDAYTNDNETFDKYFNEAEKEFSKYHKLFDAYNNYPNLNNVKTINDNAGIKPVKVNVEVYNVIKQSIDLNKKVFHKNNIALAPITLEYKKAIDNYMDKKIAKHPDMNILKQKASCSNINDIELLSDNQIYLKQKCNALDVGSVAKGYVAQTVANKLEKSGLSSGILNAGGNVVVIGSKPGDKPFKVGIADPENRNDYFVNISARSTNVVTSGDYERYYELDGIKYHHIVDPDTLKPANKYLSFTIIMEDGFLADYFSTECFMLEQNQVEKLAKEYKFEYVAMKKDKSIIISDGLKDEVQLK